MRKRIGSALVVGAGISGIRAALDLAEVGYHVTLIDKAPNLGGTLAQLDYQFPNDRCGMCKMLPLVDRDTSSQYCLRKGLFHENIDIMLSAEVAALEGEPGNFQVTLRQKPTMVDPKSCIGCNECSRVCPVEVPDEFNAGLTTRKAIYLPIPHNIPNTYVVDMVSCTMCNECEKVCPTGAIQFVEEDRECEIEVGSVILSAGFNSFNPSTGKITYGYGQFPNVVTSIEFERLISGTGPNQGRLLRPGDGKEIHKVAWFQCVGSRDQQADADFCSSACCMFAIKEALLAKEKSNGQVDAAIFFMDMRVFGKDFQRYRDEAEQKHGVRFIRNRVHSVELSETDGDLRVIYLDTNGEMHEEDFGLVVLAAGQRPPEGTRDLAKITGVNLNPWGFCQAEGFSLVRTNQEGILVGGAFSGLKDISESVIQASSASLGASLLIHSKVGGIAEEPETVPKYRDVSREMPRVLVVTCACGGGLAESVDLDALGEALKGERSVTEVHHIDRICTKAGWDELEKTIQDSNANRVLIGACMPYVYARKLGELGRGVGLDPALIDVVDIRTRTSPGRDMEKKALSQNLLAEMSMGISRIRGMCPTPEPGTKIVPKALVVGAGIAGMTAALGIADHGFKVSLVEQSGELGGNLRSLHRTIDGNSPLELLNSSISKVEDHPNIQIYLKSNVIHSQGNVGRFYSTIEKEDGVGETIEHGVTVLATGGSEAKTESYAYKESEAVYTQHELELNLANGTIDPSNLTTVAMIQCVDSREEPRNYCSRICCTSALKNALYLKAQNSEIDVYIFYRDMMSYGFFESYYTQARKKGVIFIRYNKEQKPEVSLKNGRPLITAEDPILGRKLGINADLLVLSTGIVPSDVNQLPNLFGLEVNQDGFFLEAESKWRPVDFLREGIFMAGIAHSPCSITESIAMAEAAAQRSLRILSSERLASGRVVAEVRHALCSLCERCITACPYGARWYNEDEEKISLDRLMCQGCGSCATVCPNSASVLRGYADQQVFEVIDAALDGIFAE